MGYARPHEMELSRGESTDGLPATVYDVRMSGALVKVELRDEGSGEAEAAPRLCR